MHPSIEELRQLSCKTLESQKVPEASAWLQTDLLIEAELRGLPSHGFQRLPRLVKRLQEGFAHPRAKGRAEWVRPAVLKVDGEQGLGPIVMTETLNLLELRVRQEGVAIAAIRNANHIGMLAYYAEAAVALGRIGLFLTTSEALVHPFGGTEPMLGTNPIAIGIPTDDTPFILDLATSLVSMGKIHHHALTGTQIPKGWAVDAQGHGTTDPVAAKDGAIAPFGDAKGYGLGLAVELLVATLAGSAFAPDVRGTLDATHPANKGDVIVLIDPASMGGNGTALAAYLDSLRASRSADPADPFTVPGDRMRARREAAMKHGITLPDTLLNEIRGLVPT
ncbi:Ldh family oxidoreductase [Pseudosulfitobacter koreensis]|uniref:Ldh family oxidoreductase n=1 Tax=Pseudosulfitobacter koreensis TaxID=2968472 RepID=A0ABT1Z509_9RHOB|nr:Ldh family oxidoreductase [Pseudosulfitobacter koreense]